MEESSDARELPKSDKPAFPRPKPGVDGKFTSVLLSAFFTSSALDSAMDTILPLIRDRNYTQVARQCRELEATILITNPTPVFYSVFIMSHLFLNELPSARAVFSRVPQTVKDTPTIEFMQLLLQRVGNRDYLGIYPLIQQVEMGEAILESPLDSLVVEYRRTWQTRTLELLTKAYGSIPPQKAAEYLGLSSENVILALQQEKWTYDAEKNLLIPAMEEKRTVERKNEAEFADLARLTEIAMILKGR